MRRKTITLRVIAREKSVKDITSAISGTVTDLLRAKLSNGYANYDERYHLTDTVRQLAKMRKKITDSGMGTALTDCEVRLLVDLVFQLRASKAYRLAPLINGVCDVQNLLDAIPGRIDSLYGSAKLADMERYDNGSDLSEDAFNDRLEALKLQLIGDTISRSGMDALLSADQVRSIINLLFCELNVQVISFKRKKNEQKRTRELQNEQRRKEQEKIEQQRQEPEPQVDPMQELLTDLERWARNPSHDWEPHVHNSQFHRLTLLAFDPQELLLPSAWLNMTRVEQQKWLRGLLLDSWTFATWVDHLELVQKTLRGYDGLEDLDFLLPKED